MPHKSSNDFDLKQNFKIYREPLLFNFFWLKHLGSTFVVWKIFKKEKAAILAINDILPLGYPALILNLFLKIPYFVFLHGLDFLLAKRNAWKRFWLKKILENAEFVVCNSRYLENEVKKLNSIIKTIVVYPSINFNRMALSDNLISAKKNLSHVKIEDGSKLINKKIIFSLGRLVKRKSFDNLILAFEKVQKKFPESELIIAGTGPEEIYLKDLAKNSFCSAKIIFLGEISEEEKQKWFKLCDLFALPVQEINGDIEGFGIVFLEAAIFNKPSVAGHVGGVSEAVVDGETGILVDGNNIDEISEAIMKLLEDDKLRQKMGEAAKRRAIDEFNIDIQISKLQKMIDSFTISNFQFPISN
jgi:phosphatidylinositol alpha-1,6-mannosyltransferase